MVLLEWEIKYANCFIDCRQRMQGWIIDWCILTNKFWQSIDLIKKPCDRHLLNLLMSWHNSLENKVTKFIVLHIEFQKYRVQPKYWIDYHQNIWGGQVTEFVQVPAHTISSSMKTKTIYISVNSSNIPIMAWDPFLTPLSIRLCHWKNNIIWLALHTQAYWNFYQKKTYPWVIAGQFLS